jgi:hypothetical protein
MNTAHLLSTQVQETEISQATVKAALNALLYTTTVCAPNPLLHLLLVDNLLRTPDTPPSPHNRELGLQTLLISSITTSYLKHRARLELSIPQESDGQNAVYEHIKQDIQTNNIELISWSWLYHRYVRVDINLTSQRFCQLGALDERTQRRYQNHAIRRLTEYLHTLEWEARKTYRQHRLYKTLPVLPQRLFGREHFLAHLEELQAFPGCIQITGDEGIGKTALIGEFLKRQIKADKVDDIVWLSKPTTVALIQAAICACAKTSSLAETDEYATHYKTILVLDNIEALEDGAQNLDELLAALHHVYIYIVNRRYCRLSQTTAHIILHELDREATCSAIRHLQTGHAACELRDSEIEMLWQSIGGNPLQIQRELSSLIAG